MANEQQHLHTHTIKPFLTQYPPPGTPGKSIPNIPRSAAVISPSLQSVNRLSLPLGPTEGRGRQKADAALALPSEQLPKSPLSPRAIIMEGTALSGCAGVFCLAGQRGMLSLHAPLPRTSCLQQPLPAPSIFWTLSAA